MKSKLLIAIVFLAILFTAIGTPKSFTQGSLDPKMSEIEKKENLIRQQLIYFGKFYGWNDNKTSDLLSGYFAQPTAPAKEQYWREETSGLPLWIQKSLNALRNLREQHWVNFTRPSFLVVPLSWKEAILLEFLIEGTETIIPGEFSGFSVNQREYIIPSILLTMAYQRGYKIEAATGNYVILVKNVEVESGERAPQ